MDGYHPSVPSVAVDAGKYSGKTLRDLVGEEPEKYLHKSII